MDSAWFSKYETPSGAAAPGNLIEMQIPSPSWNLLNQSDTLGWAQWLCFNKSSGDSGLSRELPLLIEARDLAA